MKLVQVLSFTIGLVFVSTADSLGKPIYFWVSGSEGVTLAAIDEKEGKLKEIKKVSDHSLTWMVSSNHLLVGGSTLKKVKSKTDGALSTFHIQPDQTLNFIHQKPARGKTTIHLALDPHKKMVFAVNFRKDTYVSRGSVVAFELQSNGKIGSLLNRFEHPGKGGSSSNRQLASHPHSIIIDPQGKYAAVGDLGVDKVFIYRILDKSKGLKLTTEISGRPGQQPRHLAWHPKKDFIYCMNEAAPTVSVLQFDRKKQSGKFIQHTKRIQAKGGGGADIQIDSKGQYVYGSNRGEDTLVAFKVDQNTGQLTLIGHISSGGKSTRSIKASPNDRWLLIANQSSHQVKLFSIDPDSGRLRDTSQALDIKNPTCVLFLNPH